MTNDIKNKIPTKLINGTLKAYAKKQDNLCYICKKDLGDFNKDLKDKKNLVCLYIDSESKNIIGTCHSNCNLINDKKEE